MNRRELLDKLSASAEERVLLGRLWDGWERCRSRNVPEASGFLSPHEQALAGQLIGRGLPFGAAAKGPSAGSCTFCRIGWMGRTKRRCGACDAGSMRRTTPPIGIF